ncbi:MAG: hypothetical protein Q8M40_06270 [Legionella sp.]|nr:hypothetical protein [Legionella sp.]
MTIYIISNERKVDQIIEQLRTKKFPPSDTKNKSTLIIGEGSVTSMLPELSALCDNVILADINSAAIEHNQLMIDLLLMSSNRAEFAKLYKENAGVYIYHMLEEYEQNGDWGQIGLKKLYARAEDLGTSFFLSSEERFLQCKKAAEWLKIEPLIINIFDLEQVKLLQHDLKSSNRSISVINVTNLYEWDASKNVLECKKRAEWQPNNNVSNMLNLLLNNSSEYIILYSGYEKNDDLNLVAKVSTTIDDYLSEVEQAVQEQIAVYEKSFQKLCAKRVTQAKSIFYSNRTYEAQKEHNVQMEPKNI